MADSSGGIMSPISSVMRNRIINGQMTIDQRNAGASVTPADGTYTLDRWNFNVSQSSKLTAQQSSTAPTGFTNSLKVTSSSAYSVSSGDFFVLQQRIEGYNVADLMAGSANAKTITVRFWVESSLTGTFNIALSNGAFNRSYPATYTISSANTWEQKTVTLTLDTSGTWLTTNGAGLVLFFNLGSGSSMNGTNATWASGWLTGVSGATNVVGTSGATYYITGVQLEKGSSATGFEYRQYTTELSLCQRYCQVSKGSDGVASSFVRIGYGPCQNTTSGIVQYKPLVTFRSQPTLTATGSYAVYDGVTVTATTSLSIDGATAPYLVELGWAVSGGGMTAIRGYELIINNSASTTLILSAEL
jgi:hypothetical protein